MPITEARRQQNRAYYLRNRERIAAADRQKYAERGAEIRAQQRARRAADPEGARRYLREYMRARYARRAAARRGLDAIPE